MFPVAMLLLVAAGNALRGRAAAIARLEAHPLRSARDCLMQRAGRRRSPAGARRRGIYAVGEQRWFLHSYYYYLHHVGGWERAATMDPAPLDAALFEPGHQRPVLIGDADYRAFKADHAEALQLGAGAAAP